MPPIIKPEGPPEEGGDKRPLALRLAWFVGLAVASSAAVAAVAYLLRALIV